MAKRSKKKKKLPQMKATAVTEAVPNENLLRKEIPRHNSPGLNWKIILQALLIAAAVLWIYWPALHGDWLWDDGVLITDNAVMRDPFGLGKIWLEPGSLIDYQPLKFSVVWLQWHLWGNDTLGYHLTNVVLHTTSALLIWRLLSKFGLRLAWLGGLIFAIHPVQVESVAWIAELKNTLSLPPFLLAMCAWIDYEERGKSRDYLLALGLFLVAMSCKPTMVMFPMIILLYAWWKRGCIAWKDVRFTLPFFMVSLALGLVTIGFLHHHAIDNDPIPMGGLFSRVTCAGLALAFYFSKCFLPLGLLPIYPRWIIDPSSLEQFLPWPILIFVICYLWTKRASWGRHALLGLAFFLINLAPFVGFVAGSYMAFTWVMDHILYIPVIGLIGLTVAALDEMGKQLPATYRPYLVGMVTAVVLLLAGESRSYAKIFINEQTLWSYELQYNPNAYLAHNELGLVFLSTGQTDAAIEQFEKALRLKPDYATAQTDIGNALSRKGRVDEALAHYYLALSIDPDDAGAHYNIGNVLMKKGRLDEAIIQYQEALKIRPEESLFHNNLGNAFIQKRQLADAKTQFRNAVQIDPNNIDAHNNLGWVLSQMGLASEAISEFQKALEINPNIPAIHYNLGNALLQVGLVDDAITQFQEDLRLNPNDARGQTKLAQAQALSAQRPGSK